MKKLDQICHGFQNIPDISWYRLKLCSIRREIIILWKIALYKDKQVRTFRWLYFVESYLTFLVFSTSWLNIEDSSFKSYLKIDFSLATINIYPWPTASSLLHMYPPNQRTGWNNSGTSISTEIPRKSSSLRSIRDKLELFNQIFWLRKKNGSHRDYTAFQYLIAVIP